MFMYAIVSLAVTFICYTGNIFMDPWNGGVTSYSLLQLS